MFPDPLPIYPDLVALTDPIQFVKTACVGGTSTYKALHTEEHPRGEMPSTFKLAVTQVGKGDKKRMRYQLRVETDSHDESSGVGVYGTKDPTVAYVVIDSPVNYIKSGLTQRDVVSFALRTLMGAIRSAGEATADTPDYMTGVDKMLQGEV